MIKKEVQKHLTKNNKPLPLKDFHWDKKTSTLKLLTTGVCVNQLTATTFTKCQESTFTNCWRATFTKCCDSTFSSCRYSTFTDCWDSTFTDCRESTFTDCWRSTFTECRYSTFTKCWDSTWLIDDIKYNYPPLHLAGSRWEIYSVKPGILIVGCEEHSVTKWRKKSFLDKLFNEHTVRPELRKEYRSLIKLALSWMTEKSWDKEKKG